MTTNWDAQPLAELGDLIGKAIMLVSEFGAYHGGLLAITETDIQVEIGEGRVISIDRTVLDNDLTELYVAEVR